jgi:hypothetical protein
MKAQTYKKISFTFFGIFYVLFAVGIIIAIFFKKIPVNSMSSILTFIWVTLIMFALGLFFLILQRIKSKKSS